MYRCSEMARKCQDIEKKVSPKPSKLHPIHANHYPMASNPTQPEEQNSIDALNDNLTNMGRQVATNKRALYVAFGAILIIAAATFGYLYLVRNPKLNKAYEAYNKVETVAMGNDSIAAAEYKKVADNYSGNPANLASLSAGEALYNQGKYKEAAQYIEKFSTSDKVLEANAKTLLGDCYVNLKQYDKAIDAFNSAIKKAEGNPQIAPRVLLKEATVYDAQKKYDKALECYQNIKDNYPEFRIGTGVDIDAYIAREKARLGK